MKKLILSLFVVLLTTAPALAETAYERIIRTGEIRCGYVIVEPTVMKDPNSGEFSGLVYELVEAIGQALQLKIKWEEEVSFSTAIEGIKTGRYDVICAQLYARPNVMKDLELTEPYHFITVNAYVRPDETRFQTKSDLNNSNITISYQDHSIADLIKQTDYPKATALSLPDFNYSDILLSVATGKADVTFVDTAVAQAYQVKNSNTIKKLDVISPVRLFPNVLGVKKGEHNLNTMLSWAIRYLHYNGHISDLITKYERYPNSFLIPAKPYAQGN